MTSCEALIFDVDGTLADTEELHRRAFNMAFRVCRLDWSWDVRLYAELLRVTGGKERLASYIERLGLPATERRCLHELIPQLHSAKTRIYRDLVGGGSVRFRSGVTRLMSEARAAGIRLAIASTTSPENIEPLLIAGLGPQGMSWFDTIATGDVVVNKKPAPDIYNVALQALDVAPACAIAVEDSSIGVQSAKAAGLFTVATPSRWSSGQDFSAADLVLGSLGDIDDPVGPADHALLGTSFLTLEQLAALHAVACTGATGARHVQAH
jgi:beta-phosphoglucomutase-like phosphatase (HAD superfamily)